jgi:biopolymer transport protein ExbB/TolQ
MHRLRERSNQAVEKVAVKTTHWIGSTGSLIVHTFLFAGAFVSYFFNVAIDDILLVLTTIVSLEAIYLSIFIQMSVNRQYRKLHDVAEDVEDIQEDVDEIQKDVDEIQKDVDEIQEDVEDIQEEDNEDDKEQKKGDDMMIRIEETLGKLIEEVIDLKKQHIKQSKSKKSDE